MYDAYFIKKKKLGDLVKFWVKQKIGVVFKKLISLAALPQTLLTLLTIVMI
jgi:hypothetical protein